MRFLGLGLADTVPDANTIWPFRETLTRACIEGKPAIEVVFDRFNATLAAVGFLAMSGQIADSDDVGRAFRLMSATHFDQSRPAVPIDVGFEAHAGCLLRIITDPVPTAQPQRPSFVEPALKNTE